jgi:hypothetical protein
LNFWAACCWATALGIDDFGSTTDPSTVLGDITVRKANSQPGSGGVYVYPAGYFTANDYNHLRYAYQPSFAL